MTMDSATTNHKYQVIENCADDTSNLGMVTCFF